MYLFKGLLFVILVLTDRSLTGATASSEQYPNQIVPVSTTATIAFVDAQANSLILASIVGANSIQTTYDLQCATTGVNPQSSNLPGLGSPTTSVPVQTSCSLAPNGETVVQSAGSVFIAYEYWSAAQRTW